MTRLETILMALVLLLIVAAGHTSTANGCDRSDDPIACLIRLTE